MSSQDPHGEVDDESAPHDGVLVLQDERHHRRQERVDHLMCVGKIYHFHCITHLRNSWISKTMKYASGYVCLKDKYFIGWYIFSIQILKTKAVNASIFE